MTEPPWHGPPVDLRLWIRTLQARARAAQRRGLTAEEEQALAELRAAVRRLLDEANDPPREAP